MSNQNALSYCTYRIGSKQMSAGPFSSSVKSFWNFWNSFEFLKSCMKWTTPWSSCFMFYLIYQTWGISAHWCFSGSFRNVEIFGSFDFSGFWAASPELMRWTVLEPVVWAATPCSIFSPTSRPQAFDFVASVTNSLDRLRDQDSPCSNSMLSRTWAAPLESESASSSPRSFHQRPL